MNFIKMNFIRNRLHKFNSLEIFALSFLICISFYLLEGLLGIDRFYHPDSNYYLKPRRLVSYEQFIDNPKILIHRGYFILTNILNNNYYLLILFNFILYSLTNVLIFNKVYKKYFYALDNFKLFFLFYLLFLDPYRLHLASHILKETALIFLIIGLILSNYKITKVAFIILLLIFRRHSWIYLLIFLKFSNIKKILTIKNIYIFFIVILILFTLFLISGQNIQEVIESIYNFILNQIKKYDAREMPMRPYDHVTQFKDYVFPINFILKNITWPILLISGLFMIFVSSLLFKFLGLIILVNNILVYFITKKTFISLGLLIILVMISVYTSSYTSMFRYSYIAIYSSVIYFFYSLDLNYLKNSKKF